MRNLNDIQQVPKEGLEPSLLAETDFESVASTIPPLWQVMGFYRIFLRARQVRAARPADFVLIFAIVY